MTKLVESQGEGSNNSLINHVDNALDMYFQIHEKVNARNEEIQKSYKNNIIVSFNDIEELHLKTMQSISSLNPAKSAIGIRIAISHNEGDVEKFNSFESFKKHNKTSPNPTASINMVYTFTLYDAESKNFENYKILNQIRSRVVELKQLENEAPAFISKAIISSMVTITARIVVEYSDYVKARHFTAMFDEWIKGCDENKMSVVMQRLKLFSHHITHFGQILILAMLGFFTVLALGDEFFDKISSVKFLVAYATIFMVLGGVVKYFLRKLELAIDGYLAISYLDFNKGDSKLKAEYENRNKRSIFDGVLGVLGVVALGFLTDGAYDIIKWLIVN